MKNKIIKSIRIYSKDHSAKLDKEIVLIGTRFGRKLNEFEFEVKRNDNFNIYLRSDLEKGAAFFYPEDKLDLITKGIQKVDFGLDPKDVNLLNIEHKRALIINSITKVLVQFSKSNNLEPNIKKVDLVKVLIKEYGDELEILYKEIELDNIKLIFSYQINPRNSNYSTVLLEYIDLKKAKNSFKQNFLQAWFYEDIYYLIDKVTMKNDIITVQPRKSFISKIYLKNYHFPIIIPLRNDLKIHINSN